MSGQQVNRDLLLHKIAHSRELTAIEKLYLERLLKADERHGHWIDQQVCECSECGGLGIAEFCFCPFCGAEMNGGETDENSRNNERFSF